MLLHEKFAQQLPLRRKHTGRIMEVYAFLRIYASGRNALNTQMSVHRGRPPCVTKEVGWVCGSRLEAAVAWPVPACGLVAGGGHL
jgi:hypothetical protein